MGVLTLLTDFGYRDHYVAALKARLLQLAPTLAVMDITHGVEPYNIAHAVHVLRAVFRDFPTGTTHLITVSDYGASPAGAVAAPAWHAAQHEGHYFVAADNGLLSLLCDGLPERLVRLSAVAPPTMPVVATVLPSSTPIATSLNPTRDVLAPAAVSLALGHSIDSLGLPPAAPARQPRDRPRGARRPLRQPGYQHLTRGSRGNGPGPGGHRQVWPRGRARATPALRRGPARRNPNGISQTPTRNVRPIKPQACFCCFYRVERRDSLGLGFAGRAAAGQARAASRGRACALRGPGPGLAGARAGAGMGGRPQSLGRDAPG
nr:hypothetical protein [Tanacetum cinerariifolium]